jgi:hypothetical protein
MTQLLARLTQIEGELGEDVMTPARLDLDGITVTLRRPIASNGLGFVDTDGDPIYVLELEGITLDQLAPAEEVTT